VFGEKKRGHRALSQTVQRHGRACPGHPRLAWQIRKAWMPGTSPGMTNENSRR
jgi:hypothetical protein